LLKPIGDGRNTVSKAKIGKGDVQAFKPIEALWVYPTTYDSTDPLKPTWYNPEIWYVMGKRVHASRLLTFIARPVPDMLKPAYSFGGFSLVQLIKPYVDNWIRTRQSVADIVSAFSTFVLSTDLSQSLMGDGQYAFQRAEMFNNLRNNRGLMMLNKDSEEFQNVSASLAGLDVLDAQALEQIAAISGIPLVKLLGISPHGLNATAEPELRAFYDRINAMQEYYFRPNVTKVVDFVQLSLFGKIDHDITFKFVPLWSLSEKDAADVKKTEAETGQIHIDSGAISPEEERERIVNDPGSPYVGLDPADVPDLLDEEQAGGIEPEGGRPDPLAEREAA
jgi:uncharacterized protein